MAENELRPTPDDNEWPDLHTPTYGESNRTGTSVPTKTLTGWWVLNPSTEPKHQCQLPDGPWIVGALWKCTELHLWQIVELPHEQGGIYVVDTLEWRPASRWTRRKYGPGMQRAHLAMGDPSARQRQWRDLKPPPPPGPGAASTTCTGTASSLKPPKPPTSTSGISPDPDGKRR